MKYLKQSILTVALISATSAQAAMQDFDFNTDMTLGGDAYISQSHVNNGVILTPNKKWQKGSAFTNMSFENVGSFSAEFDIKMGWGSEADGLTFAWVTDPNASTTGGGNLGFTGMTGYAVEFDTYRNSWDSGSSNHVAVIQNSASNALIQEDVDFNLSSNSYRHVHIDFDNGDISVNIDGETFIDDFTIENYQADDFYFGFTAATGGKTDWHKVRNFSLEVSPVPEPSTYALMLGGLGMVGFMAFRRRKQQVNA
ncbi:MAG: PEP-CTERM sorting domain-containing protein [Thiomicrorhabdus sp.]|nr:PEP-CTERM sorting domain-containing protein [Thiomicrorhabdus sp.]